MTDTRTETRPIIDQDAAHELLALATQYRSDLRYPPTGDSIERRLAAIEAGIARASTGGANDLLAALATIDEEAPAKEPRDGPTVGFQPSHDPEEDDGNETVREAFDEGVRRGLWMAADVARRAIQRATGGAA
ncbi:MAG: hypothetical protein V4696_07610 [Pseudomonadota bacterium]